MLRDQEDEIYVPVSLRTLRKLDQLVQLFETAGEGFTEDRIISMGLDNLLASMRQFDNENFPPPPTDAYPSGHTSGTELAGIMERSTSELPASI